MNNNIENLLARPLQETLDIICLQRLCPCCNSNVVNYITYECDNEIYFECDSCSWDVTVRLDLVRDAGFYPEY